MAGGKGLYCSRECARIASQKRIRIDCATCGKVVEKRLSAAQQAKTGLLFCNRECKEKAQMLSGYQILHPSHYRSGKTGYRKRALRWKAVVCGDCGYSEYLSMLDVHHKDGNRQNGNLENLEVLCVWCHAIRTRKIAWHGWQPR